MRQVMSALAWTICATLLGPAAQAASVADAQAISWTVGAKQGLHALFRDLRSTNAFIREVLPKPAEGDPPPDTNEVSFADLAGDGSLELICSLGDGVRFYPSVLVISKVSGNFVYSMAYNGGAMDVPLLGDVIVDVDGQGHRALLVPRRLGPYRGAQPVPVVYDIYKLRHHRLEKADLESAAYYRSVLIPRLRSRLSVLKWVAPNRNAEMAARQAEEASALRQSIAAMEAMLRAR